MDWVLFPSAEVDRLDDRRPGPVGAGLRRGRGAQRDLPRRGGRAPVKLARDLRAIGARAGLALRPATPVEPYADLAPKLYMRAGPGTKRRPALP